MLCPINIGSFGPGEDIQSVACALLRISLIADLWRPIFPSVTPSAT